MTHRLLLGAVGILVVTLGACIESASPAGDESEGDESEGEGGASGGAASRLDAEPSGAGASMGGSTTDAGLDEPPPLDARAGGEMPPVDPPDAAGPGPVEDLCAQLCERIDACFPAACRVLEATPSDAGFCEFCEMLPEGDVRKLLGAECREINETVFEARPDLRMSCEGGMMPPPGPPLDPAECEALCDRVNECPGALPIGMGGRPPPCEVLCEFVPPEAVPCIEASQSCDALAMCFGMMPIPGMPDPETSCGNVCRRTAGCVQSECAPGTLPAGWIDSCTMECLGAPPTPDALRAFNMSTCEDIVSDLRMNNRGINQACDATPEEACTTLCRDRIVPCGGEGADDQAACEVECAGFDEVNLRCVQQAQECERLATCFGDVEGQARCERICERIEGCLLEACPPRVIPPDLSVGCAAGCLQMPPDEMEVAEVEAASCGDVRRLVYRENRELAPVCEGGRDFRPTADECAAFCDNGLEACLGIGGRPFCLAGCASLTRDEYTCALEAMGDCAAIGECLAAE